MADMAFALLLDVARGVSAGDRFVRRGDWSQQRFGIHHRVYGKRLGILGMGRIGHAVARRGTAFDMQVSYHKRKPVEGSPYLYTESVHGLAQWADFLIVTVAGGEQTRHLIDANVLDALGPTAFLINVARGSVVDERALVHALQDGRIAGAGLDVYEDDPRPYPGLEAMDNVVLAPHIGSGTHATRHAMADWVLENIRTWPPVVR